MRREEQAPREIETEGPLLDRPTHPPCRTRPWSRSQCREPSARTGSCAQGAGGGTWVRDQSGGAGLRAAGASSLRCSPEHCVVQVRLAGDLRRVHHGGPGRLRARRGLGDDRGGAARAACGPAAGGGGGHRRRQNPRAHHGRPAPLPDIAARAPTRKLARREGRVGQGAGGRAVPHGGTPVQRAAGAAATATQRERDSMFADGSGQGVRQAGGRGAATGGAWP